MPPRTAAVETTNLPLGVSGAGTGHPDPNHQPFTEHRADQLYGHPHFPSDDRREVLLRSVHAHSGAWRELGHRFEREDRPAQGAGEFFRHMIATFRTVIDRRRAEGIPSIPERVRRVRRGVVGAGQAAVAAATNAATMVGNGLNVPRQFARLQNATRRRTTGMVFFHRPATQLELFDLPSDRSPETADSL